MSHLSNPPVLFVASSKRFSPAMAAGIQAVGLEATDPMEDQVNNHGIDTDVPMY